MSHKYRGITSTVQDNASAHFGNQFTNNGESFHSESPTTSHNYRDITSTVQNSAQSHFGNQLINNGTLVNIQYVLQKSTDTVNTPEKHALADILERKCQKHGENTWIKAVNEKLERIHSQQENKAAKEEREGQDRRVGIWELSMGMNQVESRPNYYLNFYGPEAVRPSTKSEKSEGGSYRRAEAAEEMGRAMRRAMIDERVSQYLKSIPKELGGTG